MIDTNRLALKIGPACQGPDRGAGTATDFQHPGRRMGRQVAGVFVEQPGEHHILGTAFEPGDEAADGGIIELVYKPVGIACSHGPPCPNFAAIPRLRLVARRRYQAL